jgi:hypothetical protein
VPTASLEIERYGPASRSLVGKLAGTSWAIWSPAWLKPFNPTITPSALVSAEVSAIAAGCRPGPSASPDPTQRQQIQQDLRAHPHAANGCRHRHRSRRARNRSICSSDVPAGRARGQTNPRDCRIARILRSFVHVQGPFMVTCPGWRMTDRSPAQAGPRRGKPEGAPSRGKRGGPDGLTGVGVQSGPFCQQKRA